MINDRILNTSIYRVTLAMLKKTVGSKECLVGDTDVQYLVIHVHDVHLLEDEFWTALVLLGHLTNGHVRDVNGSDAPENIY
jgi:hypothetical protein